MSIAELLRVPHQTRDSCWLRSAVQEAIRLELATIPVYLTGMWSIIDRTTAVRRHIKGIVVEEMLHMGWMCNLLTALGDSPLFNTPETAPKFPGPLPGGVRPQLRVWLAGFSRASLRAVFMEIEMPEHGPIAKFLGREYPTIGAFYQAIRDVVDTLSDSDFTAAKQHEDPMLGLTLITTKQAALDAIDVIREQGEGTASDPFPTSDPSSRAHYYRFAEMYYGRELEQTGTGWSYTGPQVVLPPAYPMVEVPEGGYPESREFDRQYTQVLDDLQAAWTTGDPAKYGEATGAMKLLETPARDLMQVTRPDGSGTLGPSFQLVR